MSAKIKGQNNWLTSRSCVKIDDGVYLVPGTNRDDSVQMLETRFFDDSGVVVIFKMAIVDLTISDCTTGLSTHRNTNTVEPKLSEQACVFFGEEVLKKLWSVAPPIVAYLVEEIIIFLFAQPLLELSSYLKLVTSVAAEGQLNS